MPHPRGPRLRLRALDAIEALVPIVSGAEHNILITTCIDPDGYVGLSECFRWTDGHKSELALEDLWDLPREDDAMAVLIASQPDGQIECLAESAHRVHPSPGCGWRR
jgi:hypothetical protein